LTDEVPRSTTLSDICQDAVAFENAAHMFCAGQAKKHQIALLDDFCDRYGHIGAFRG
jgi:hypothetical protein